MRHISLMSLVVTGAILAGPAAHAAIRVTAHWDVIEVEVAPRSATYRLTGRGANFVLDEGHVVTRDAGQQADVGFQQQALMRNVRGAQYLTKFKIHNGQITKVNRFFGKIETVTVSTNGRDSCTARVDYRPIAGQRFIMDHRVTNGELMYISSQVADNVSCSIANE